MTEGICYGCDDTQDVETLHRYEGGWFCDECYDRIRTTARPWVSLWIIMFGLFVVLAVVWLIGFVLTLLP